MMRLEAFERRAREMWEEIPDEYKEGVDGLVVHREELPHPTLAEIYTLGECATESYPSEWGGPETIRSVLILYHGSFRRLAELSEDFDWEEELWETITHELRHHLEWLAAEDALEGVDYAADENFKRLQGEPFDPYFYRFGEPVAEGMFQVEREFFIEREYDASDDGSGPVEFTWRGRRFAATRPTDTGDICFIHVEEGLDAGVAEVTLVLVRRRGTLAALRELFGRGAPRVTDAAAAARPGNERGKAEEHS